MEFVPHTKNGESKTLALTDDVMAELLEIRLSLYLESIGAGDGSAGLAQDSVIQGDTQRAGVRCQCLHLRAHLSEDGVCIDPVPGIERIVGGPVAELIAEGRDQSRDGMAAGTDQMG